MIGLLNEQPNHFDLESHNRMLLMLEAAPLCIGFFDRELNLIDCNQEAVDTFRFSDKDEYRSNFWKTMPANQPSGENTREEYQQAITKAFLLGEYKCELVRKRNNGELFPSSSAFVRVPYKDDFVVLCYTRDMTEIALAKQREETAHAMTRQMLDSVPMAVFLMRSDFTAVDCNCEAIDLFGFENKEHALREFRRIFPAQKESGTVRPYDFNDLEWLAESGYHSFEFDHQTIYGDPVACNVVMVSLLLRDGQRVTACYLQDLRAMKAMSEELHRVEITEKESQAKSNFLARMSHEIRTPLNAIMGTADIQLQKNGHTPEVEEAFIQIQNSSALLMSIIRDILDLSRVEQGKLPIEPEEYDTENLISTSVQLNLMQLGSKQIRFTISADSDLPKILYGDHIRVKQILNNIMSNAFKYTHEGEVKASFVTCRTKGVNLAEDEICFLIRVTDTGRGMNQEQIDILLSQEYIRFYEAGNRSIEGTGLGMAITRQLIKLMGGKIRITSEEGKGTTVVILLPQKRVSQETIGREGAHRIETMEITRETFGKDEGVVYLNMPYGKVLVVDDVESNLYVARGKLAPYNLNVETVDSGFAAIEKVKDGNVYDIIFMDHMMPDMDGIETTKIIMGMGYKEPIVALTANVIRGQAQLFADNGFSGFIAKPIDSNHMNSYLLRFIRDKQPPEVIEAAGKNLDYIAPDTISASLIEAFLRDAANTLKVLDSIMQAHINEDNIKLYTISVHAMKSALANIGAKKLSKSAGLLELAGHKGDFLKITTDTPAFVRNLRDLTVTLKSEEETADDDAPEPEDAPQVPEKLQELLAAIQYFNKKGAKNIIAELKAMPIGPKTKELLSELSVHLLHSEFEEAEKAVEAALLNKRTD